MAAVAAGAAAGDASRAISVFRVGMTCDGCVGAVKRILGRFEGADIAVDLPGKTVAVTHAPAASAAAAAAAERAAMLAALQKWGAAAGKEVALLT